MAAGLLEETQVLEGELLDEQLAQTELLANGLPLVRDYGEFQAIDVKSMSVDFTIVTRGSQLNRHGNKVQIVAGDAGQGLLLDNYKNNPVIFFDHAMGSLSLPIAKSENPAGELTVKLYNSKADARAYFSQTLPEAAQIFALINEGILRTASIGFIPLKAVILKQKPAKGESTPAGDEILDLGRPWVALDFLESEFLEWSVVGIPADAGAVRKCLELGKIGTEKITCRLRPALQQMAGERKPVFSGYDFRFTQSLGDYSQTFELRCDSEADLAERIKPLIWPLEKQALDAGKTPVMTVTQQAEPANSPAGVDQPTTDMDVPGDPTPASGLTPELIQTVVHQCLQQEIGKFEAAQTRLEQKLAMARGQVV